MLLNNNQLSKAVDLIVKASTALPINKPLGLRKEVFDRIQAEAKRLGEESALKTPSARFSKVRSGLQAFVKTLLGANQFSAENFDKNEQKALVDRLAHAESRTEDEKALDQLVGMSTAQLDYSQRMARWIVTVLDEMEAPGTRARLDELGAIENRLKKFSIPGRTAQGFGQRRSRFITPDSVDESYANVSTQGGVFPYSDIRKRGFFAFSRLINRERIELVTPRFNNGVNAGPLEVRIDRPLEPKAEDEPEIRRQQTNNDLLALLTETFNQLERNRLENISLLVPPGGFPDDFRSYIQVMRTKLRDDYDVRLDIVLVGPATIPQELRDLSVKSHGSVLTVTDLDEVGAIAQRLKNEQSSGAWVIVPQVSTIPQKDQAAVQQFVPQQAGPGAPVQGPQDPATFAKELRNEIVARKKIINAMTGEASDILAKLLDPKNQNPLLPEALKREPVKRQIENASVDLNTFMYLLEQLEDGEKDRDLTQTDEGARNLNRKIMNFIVQARDSLSSLEGSISLAADTTNVEASANLSDLICLAKGYSKPNDPNEKADPNRKADPKEKDCPKEKLLTPEFFQNLIDKADATDKKRFIAFKGESISKLERLRRFLRLHEKWYEAALLATKDNVPIYKRIDRTKLDSLRKQVEDVQVMQAVKHVVAPTIGAGPNDVRLARFYVEPGGKMGDFNFELVVGLARGLPLVFNSKTKRLELRLPSLDLYSDNGIIAADARNMKLEKSLFDATLLVFRAQDPSRLSEGWYTPVLRFEQEVMDQIKAPYNEINFTFSVASLRPNIQLIASLRQPDGAKTRGTIHSGEQEAVVEVLVSAGSPIRGAKVYGYFQRINTGNTDIDTQEVLFQDEGQAQPLDADRLKDDGLYTAKIPIGNLTSGTEFRVFIQADTTDGNAAFVALDDPRRFNADANNDQDQPLPLAKKKAKKSTMTKTLEAFQTKGIEDQKKAEGPAPKFQRATSLHFRVEP